MLEPGLVGSGDREPDRGERMACRRVQERPAFEQELAPGPVDHVSVLRRQGLAVDRQAVDRGVERQLATVGRSHGRGGSASARIVAAGPTGSAGLPNRPTAGTVDSHAVHAPSS